MRQLIEFEFFVVCFLHFCKVFYENWGQATPYWCHGINSAAEIDDRQR